MMTVTPQPASACEDDTEAPCATLDALRGICTPPYTPPTMLYCPKYCGLCG